MPNKKAETSARNFLKISELVNAIIIVIKSIMHGIVCTVKFSFDELNIFLPPFYTLGYFFIIFKEMEFIPSLICFKLFFYMCYNLFLTLAQDYFHLGQF